MNHRAARAIHLYSTGLTLDQVADQTGYSRDSVEYHLKRARLAGDPRAAHRTRQEPAYRRRKQIRALVIAGLDIPAIARTLGVTRRLVQMRIREME